MGARPQELLSFIKPKRYTTPRSGARRARTLETSSCDRTFTQEVWWGGPPSPRRDTFVIAASKNPLPLDDLPKTGDHWQIAPFATRIETDGKSIDAGQMKPLLHAARELILTDDFAPVDSLLKPVFVDKGVQF